MKRTPTTTGTILSISRDGHRWLFVLDDTRRLGRLYDVVGRYAADPELTFTWADARDIIAAAHRSAARHAGS